jgi:hypothetical protein
MTLNLSEAKNHGCRPHPRGSVRRASGFVLTGNTEVIELLRTCASGRVIPLYLTSMIR